MSVSMHCGVSRDIINSAFQTDTITSSYINIEWMPIKHRVGSDFYLFFAHLIIASSKRCNVEGNHHELNDELALQRCYTVKGMEPTLTQHKTLDHTHFGVELTIKVLHKFFKHSMRSNMAEFPRLI
jgi:hypothetical protein